MKKRWRATAVQDAGALTDDHRIARSVLDCASPLALWKGVISADVKPFSAERELSQLAADGITRDGWDNFEVCLPGDALRIGDNPRSVRPIPAREFSKGRRTMLLLHDVGADVRRL